MGTTELRNPITFAQEYATFPKERPYFSFVKTNKVLINWKERSRGGGGREKKKKSAFFVYSQQGLAFFCLGSNWMCSK